MRKRFGPDESPRPGATPPGLRPSGNETPTSSDGPGEPGPSGSSPEPALLAAYRLSRHHFGHLGWWPGETPFEICVGAILTQNTSWRNVERAIGQLKAAGALDAHTLFALPVQRLAQLIRPSGYYNVKARRLRAFLTVLVQQFDGAVDRMLAGATPAVRERLLAIPGIGEETADSILLYAGEHEVFVVDAYTRRACARHAWCAPDIPYGDLQRLCARAFSRVETADRLDLLRDAHAQWVMIGKDFCRPRAPRCDGCPWRGLLPAGDLRPGVTVTRG